MKWHSATLMLAIVTAVGLKGTRASDAADKALKFCRSKTSGSGAANRYGRNDIGALFSHSFYHVIV